MLRDRVEPEPTLSAGERLRLALELSALGERLVRERLRRDEPTASEAELDERVTAWRLTRPGAESGDGVGRPVPWPRR